MTVEVGPGISATGPSDWLPEPNVIRRKLIYDAHGSHEPLTTIWGPTVISRIGTNGRGAADGQEFYRVVLDNGQVLRPLDFREDAALAVRTWNRLRMPGQPGAHIERVSSRLVAALMRPSANTVILET